LKKRLVNSDRNGSNDTTIVHVYRESGGIGK